MTKKQKKSLQQILIALALVILLKLLLSVLPALPTPVELLLYQAAIAAGTPQLLEHAALHWVAVDELEQYAFCPADAPILERLRTEGLPPEFRPAS